MKLNLILLLSLCVQTSIWAQADFEPDYVTYNWESEPEWHQLDKIDTSESSVILNQHSITEYYYDPKYEDHLVEIYTIHKTIRVRNEDAIDQNNKIYIALRNSLELIDPKARVIKPNGEVINFDESNIMESEEVENIGGLKYFAIDGIVKDADIEYMYTVKRVPHLDGYEIEFQDDIPMQNVSARIVTPRNLHLKFKSYNDLPDFERDTLNEDKNVHELAISDVEKMKDEDYCTYDRNFKRAIYKLDYNSFNNQNDLTSFSKIAQRVYENTHYELEKKTIKKMNKLLDEWGVNDAPDLEAQIRLLELKIKSGFQLIDGAPTAKVGQILDDKYTSKYGMSTLFTNFLTLMDVKYEIGLTCDRFSFYFDEEFEHYQVLQDFFIYVPKLKKYLSPTEFDSRLGYLPYEMTSQHGLFIKKIDLGEGYTGLAKVKEIPALDHESSVDDMVIDVDLSDMISPKVKFTRTLSGYSAVGLQTFYDEMEDDQQTELNNAFIKFASNEGTVLSHEVKGTKPEDAGVNPLVFTGELEAPSLIERAGPRFMFNLGEVIGQQAEMYQEEERMFDIENDFNRSYTRVVTFKIPDGYKVSNLEALNFDEAFPKDKPTAIFKSTFTQEGNEVKINITEYYSQISYPKGDIEGFKEIINAAANFNKVTLFIEKV